MGRAKKPVALLDKSNLTKEVKEARAEHEAKMKSNNERLKAPSWLNKEAKKEFNRVVKEMREVEALNDLLSNLDLGVLAIYANAYSNYVTLSKQIDQEGITTEYTNKGGATNTVINASVQAQQKYIDVIFKASAKLGLSLSDRLKLVVPKSEEDTNEFSEFM